MELQKVICLICNILSLLLQNIGFKINIIVPLLSFKAIIKCVVLGLTNFLPSLEFILELGSEVPTLFAPHYTGPGPEIIQTELLIYILPLTNHLHFCHEEPLLSKYLL